MKPQKLLLLTLLLLVLSISTFSQRRTGGKVIEVIDGKTAVVRLPIGSNLTVVLQYIEIPEPEQPFRQIVKEHLEKLILDQTVEVNARGVNASKTVGQIFLRGVDVGQQMIRDGAAWYAPNAKASQSPAESANYQSQETQAKAEKRGVWSIEGMMPAWEFRVEREEANKLAAREALEMIKIEARAVAEKNEVAAKSRKTPISKRQFSPTEDVLWSNPNSADILEVPDSKGLIRGEIPELKFPYIMTATTVYYLSNSNDGARVESRTMYMKSSGNDEFLALAFLSKSNKLIFDKSSTLLIYADGQKFTLSKPNHSVRAFGKSSEEMLMFKFTQEILLAIAQAQSVKFSLGDFATVAMPVQSHDSLKNLTLELAKK